MPAVLIFIRQQQTQMFLQEQGGWVNNLTEAQRFESTWEAIDFCMKKGVHRAEVVMRFGAPQYDVAIDVL
ncbi:MAG: hypothetical protein JWR69_2094 [Pedosphaera sp.]|nr:hypothetical protein [Pedosphaera sp.]